MSISCPETMNDEKKGVQRERVHIENTSTLAEQIFVSCTSNCEWGISSIFCEEQVGTAHAAAATGCTEYPTSAMVSSESHEKIDALNI